MAGLELDERKRKILQAIIRNYLETGEPVGSRTISKYTDLNLSSATIRNEMADLEEMGYISAFDGAKARKVLISKEEFESIYGPL